MARDSALHPFDKLSPWNRPLGANAVYDNIVTEGPEDGFSTCTMNNADWTMSVWISLSSDPIRNIRSWNPGFPQLYPTGINRNVPDAAVASPGDDAHLQVVSPDHNLCVDLFRAFKQPDGSWVADSGGVDVNLKGLGINTFAEAGGYSNAANTAGMGGLIRAGELQNGINHALQFVANPKMWNRNAPGGNPYVYPASAADGYAMQPEPGGYASTGNLYMGSLVAIPPNVNINTLGLVTAEALEIARALQNYGAYAMDSGSGMNKIVLRYDYAARLAGDLDAVLANFTAFQADLDRMASFTNIKVVSNSHNNGSAPTLGSTEGTGGGAPRVALAEDFAVGGPPPGPPSPDPTNLQVTGQTTTSISISFTDNQTDEAAFDVEYRALGAPTWIVLPDAVDATGTTGTRTYTITGLVSGKTYEIRVRGYKLV